MYIINRNTPNEFCIHNEPGNQLADTLLAQHCSDVLTKHYPGYKWSVGIDEKGGVLHIVNHDVNAVMMSNQLLAYTLKLYRVYTDPGLKCVIRAAGEILEAARLARGWATGEEPTHIDGIADQYQPINGVTIARENI